MTPRPVARVLTALVIAAGFCAGSALAAEQPPRPAAAGLRAGVARVDITPDGPVALEGYENPEQRLSEGVHDRLYARAIAFASGSQRLVLVSADLGAFMFAPYFQHRIAERLNLKPDEIVLCAIHTHSGPQLSLNPEYPHPANAAYTETLAGRLVSVVDRALRALAPVRLGVGRSVSRAGLSRRTIRADGRVEMAPNPDGVSDPEVLALTLRRQDGALMAVLFSYACHSRSLRSPNRLITGDVLGIAEQHAEARLGQPVVVAAFGGASGDIDPASVVDTFDAPPGQTPETVRLGRSLGDSVHEAVKASTPSAGLPFRFATIAAPLPDRSGGADRKVQILTAAFGDIGFVVTECEVSASIGLAVKAASPFRQTFFATVCQGWRGYLPAASQYREGGYEVNQTPFAPAAADRFVQAAVGALDRLRGVRQP